MRIIAGKNKSRKLNTLEGLNTRPMTDRMKESVFNTVGPYFDGDVVLDLKIAYKEDNKLYLKIRTI